MIEISQEREFPRIKGRWIYSVTAARLMLCVSNCICLQPRQVAQGSLWPSELPFIPE